ncbi:MAG TPA: ABC transporter substrate-binding protein [Ruminococcus sp.]|nr:ABC transporter substrate-binding protein [Ruminococcus sp.]HCR74234.1 ABC transporter substrate-binding protein [Ruminococcus sp.]
MKKLLSLFTAAFLIFMTSCTSTDNSSSDDSGKIKISATLFPQYDFARQIAGDKAEITLLLPSGMDSHSYEPTPADIININKSDLFIYTGEYLESWANDIVGDIDTDKTHVLDVSSGIQLVKEEDEHHHDDEDEHHEEEHHHEYDPHIWTSPVIAMQMADNIAEALCETDSVNSDYYKQNAENYKKQLQELDSEFREIVADGKRNTIYFGGKFALYYFTQEYGLDYVSAFDSCSGETEPSAKVMSEMISSIKENNIPVIYYEEIAEPTVANMIADETGAKPLLFHSCHNVTPEDFRNGVTYIDLMKQNAVNLREGLS